MRSETLPEDLTRQVAPRAVKNYAISLGWQPVGGVNGGIAVYHRPDSKAHQLIVPENSAFDDYADAMAEAVRKLAEFEKRPTHEVLEHLLLPPADVLRFREVSSDAEAGTLPFDHAVRMINGTKRLLLSAAHSVLVPQAYHPRLSRSEAEEFVQRCRLGQTERGSFVMTVACPLEAQLPGLQSEPFTRQITKLVMDSIAALAGAADTGKSAGLLDPAQNAGISANLCESLLMLRPSGNRASLTVSATWSRTMTPVSKEMSRQIVLSQDVFEVAEAVAPRLRAAPVPRPARFFGFVDALSGQPGRDDPRPSGEVDFTLFDEEQGELRARGILNADDYAKAAGAHLMSGVIAFRATLRRLPRLSRVDQITGFERVVTEQDKADAN